MKLENLDVYLSDIEDRIDLEQENANTQSWLSFWEAPQGNGIFKPVDRTPSQPGIDWPQIMINDAFEDPELMILREFEMVSAILARGTGHRLNVRCNYGTGILPSLFGCEMFMMDRKHNELPTAIPLHSDNAIARLVDAGVPDIKKSFGGKVFEQVDMFTEVMRKYPKISQAVELYHPDLQSTIDVAEVVWGSEIFYAFIDKSQLVHDFLSLVTQTYIAFMKEWRKLVPPTDCYTAHWGLYLKGGVMLRSDSLMNLSPDTYVEFIRDHDKRILDEFGGGGVHFCGRGDHYIQAMCELDSLTSINLSQPEYNDMEIIYQNTVDKDIRILGLPLPAAEQALADNRNLHGLACVWPAC